MGPTRSPFGGGPLPGTSAEPWHATTAEANSASTIILLTRNASIRAVCTAARRAA